jgi:hypothetical protein
VGRPSAPERGTVGGPPSSGHYGDRPPEDFLRYGSTPTVVAVGERGGFRYEVVGYKLGRERGSMEVCLDVVTPDGASGCNRYNHRIGGVSHGLTESRVTGATTVPGVAHIEIDYFRDGGPPGETEAILARADDLEVLRRVGIPERFTFYVARTPPNLRFVESTAYDEDGHVLWRARLAIEGG